MTQTSPPKTTDHNLEWGWFYVIGAIGAVGLLIVAFADASARGEMPGAELLFWIGLLVLFVPIAIRLTSSDASRGERVGLLLILGLGLYLVKVFHSPVFFTSFDEILHWRSLDEIMQNDHLFEENPILPVAPFYPGLHIVTNALVSLTGLSVFSAGILLLAAVRIVLVLMLFLFFEEISQSHQIAGIAMLVYSTNQHFLFFDSMFSYESLALSMAAMVLFALVRRSPQRVTEGVGLTLVLIFGFSALVVTHHISTYVTVLFLTLWTLVSLIRRYFIKKRNQPGVGWSTILIIAMSLTWLLYVATITIGYLAGNLDQAIIEVVRLIVGEAGLNKPLPSAVGQIPPLRERMVALITLGLVTLGLPFGLFQIWRYYRVNSAAITLAVGSLLFPASQLLRLTSNGGDIAGRITGFVFVAVGFILAVGIYWVFNRYGWISRMFITLYLTIIFVGGVIFGSFFWARLPGPYMVAAGNRSIDEQCMEAAEWMQTHYGRNRRIATDRINGLLMGAYGGQRPVTAAYDALNLPMLFLSPGLDEEALDVLEDGEIDFVVMDYRLGTDLPLQGYYYDKSELYTYQHNTPIDSTRLRKFDGVENINRILDSGDIVIYDVSRLHNAP